MDILYEPTLDRLHREYRKATVAFVKADKAADELHDALLSAARAIGHSSKTDTEKRFLSPSQANWPSHIPSQEHTLAVITEWSAAWTAVRSAHDALSPEEQAVAVPLPVGARNRGRG
jgi:hypothetical protein